MTKVTELKKPPRTKKSEPKSLTQLSSFDPSNNYYRSPGEVVICTVRYTNFSSQSQSVSLLLKKLNAVLQYMQIGLCYLHSSCAAKSQCRTCTHTATLTQKSFSVTTSAERIESIRGLNRAKRLFFHFRGRARKSKPWLVTNFYLWRS